MKNKLNLVCLLCGILFPLFPNAIAQESDEEGIRLVVMSYTEAMATQNKKALADLHIDEAENYFLSYHPDSVSYGTQSPFDFEFWGNYQLRPEINPEEMKIHSDKRLASVWVPYTLYVNEKFSHCGIQMYNMIKIDAGWRITSLTSSLQTEDCIR